MSHRFQIVIMHPDTLLRDGELEAITGDCLRALEEAGGVLRPADAEGVDAPPTFLLVATGGSEQVILEWWAKHYGTSTDEPLWLIAHPGNNSLPASLEVLARLQQDGAKGRIFYLDGADDEDGLREIEDAVHDFHVRRELRRARIGLVGTPSDWLVASTPDASTVLANWGPTVVPVEMDEVATVLDSIPDDDLASPLKAFVDAATEVCEPTSSDLKNVTRIYLALKKVVTDYDLDALTVRCFDFVQHQRTTGCFGLAQLTDEGIIAGCEGDLVSTLGMLWAHKLLDVTPWMANPAQLDPGNNSLWLAHCTVPGTLAERYRLRSHFESGLGVGIQGALSSGPVTLLRIGGKEMERLWLAEGEILRSGEAENLCRTQAEIHLRRGGTASDLLRAPLGNHLVLAPGHHLNRLRSWWEAGFRSQA
jgi:L-fucose isomerase-like protein